MISTIIEQCLNGLTLGSIYALVALGYTMVYGILLMINFAHSEIFMIGSFVGLGTIVLTAALPWPVLGGVVGKEDRIKRIGHDTGCRLLCRTISNEQTVLR